MEKNANIKTFSTSVEAKNAFLKDISNHRDAIQKAFNIYGSAFCNIAKVSISNIEERIKKHDLSKCTNKDEMIGIIAKFYRYPMKDLPIDSNRRNIMYKKSIYAHYRNNDYYVEHWVNIMNGTYVANEMPKEAVVEMVLDWIAYSDNPYFLPADVYWETRQNKKLVHKNTITLIDNLMKEYKRFYTK